MTTLNTQNIKLFYLGMLHKLTVQYCGSVTPNTLRYWAYFQMANRSNLMAEDFGHFEFWPGKDVEGHDDLTCPQVDAILKEMTDEGLLGPDLGNEIDITPAGRAYLEANAPGLVKTHEFLDAVFLMARFTQGFEGPFGCRLLALSIYHWLRKSTVIGADLFKAIEYPNCEIRNWEVALERVREDLS